MWEMDNCNEYVHCTQCTREYAWIDGHGWFFSEGKNDIQNNRMLEITNLMKKDWIKNISKKVWTLKKLMNKRIYCEIQISFYYVKICEIVNYKFMIKLNEINMLSEIIWTKCKNKCDMKIFQISMKNNNALCKINIKAHTLNKNSRNHLHRISYSVHGFVRWNRWQNGK